MSGVDVQGVDQLKRLGRGLKAFDDRKFKNAVSRQLRTVVKPFGDAAKEHAREILPKRGGLNHIVDTARVGVRTTTSGRYTGVSITMRKNKSGSSKQRDLVNLDAGSLRHPVFGRPDRTRKQWTWVNQKVPAGFWTTPMRAQAPAAQRALMPVLDEVIKQVETHLG